jgi:hypothetical protein
MKAFQLAALFGVAASAVQSLVGRDGKCPVSLPMQKPC